MRKRKNSLEKEEYKQLGLEIKEPFKNKFFKVKGKFDLAVLYLEIKKFLKDPLLWAMIIIGLILIAQQVYLIYQSYNILPKYIPIFKYNILAQNKLALKEYIWIFPIVSGFSFLTIFALTARNYNKERNFTKILMTGALLCILSLSIILIELIKSN